MFKQRSYTKELLDEPVIGKELLYRNLQELEIINKYLGGHAVSLKGLNTVLEQKKNSCTVADIGCGGGDSLKAIARWQSKKKSGIQLKGIDLKQDCIDYAKSNCSQFPSIELTCADFNCIFTWHNKPGVIHASLFFHHFTEDEIIAFLDSCNKHNIIAVINDLERNAIAHYSIKFLTALFSKSPLVKNDAPLSVLRGFKKKEWKDMLNKAGIRTYSVKNKWAFRHLIIAYPNG